MPFTLDPEVAAGLAALMNGAPAPPPSPEGDITSRRTAGEGTIGALGQTLYAVDKKVKSKDYYAKAKDGASILLRWYTKEGSSPGSAVIYTHGGGMILGSVEIYDPIVAHYVSMTGVPFLAVDYRVAPEHPYPIPIEDAYAGLTWLHEHAVELQVDPRRIATMGDSAGGLLAASLALLARQRGGPGIAKQILIYPMLDDRNITEDAHIAAFLTWSDVDNKTAWTAYLGKARGTDSVAEVAVPARMTDGTGLPPAYIEVGELDYFRNEDIEYARKLGNAGISTELHVRPGCPHGFEMFAPSADVTKRALVDRARAVASIQALELPISDFAKSAAKI
jgi:acetyl esterase/lipase